MRAEGEHVKYGKLQFFASLRARRSLTCEPKASMSSREKLPFFCKFAREAPFDMRAEGEHVKYGKLQFFASLRARRPLTCEPKASMSSMENCNFLQVCARGAL